MVDSKPVIGSVPTSAIHDTAQAGGHPAIEGVETGGRETYGQSA